MDVDEQRKKLLETDVDKNGIPDVFETEQFQQQISHLNKAQQERLIKTGRLTRKDMKELESPADAMSGTSQRADDRLKKVLEADEDGNGIPDVLETSFVKEQLGFLPEDKLRRLIKKGRIKMMGMKEFEELKKSGRYNSSTVGADPFEADQEKRRKELRSLVIMVLVFALVVLYFYLNP